MPAARLLSVRLARSMAPRMLPFCANLGIAVDSNARCGGSTQFPTHSPRQGDDMAQAHQKTLLGGHSGATGP